MKHIEDHRMALKNGDVLKLSGDPDGTVTEFTIESEIGRGGSCIVYNATFKQSGEKRHCRLKEFYPCDTENCFYNIDRDGTDLMVKMPSIDNFEQKKKKFLDGSGTDCRHADVLRHGTRLRRPGTRQCL